MARFKITDFTHKIEEVEADRYEDNGVWIDFWVDADSGNRQVLRVKAGGVKRIERLSG